MTLSRVPTAQLSGDLNFRNRILNGNMVLDQRNSGASVTIPATGAAVYTVDRFVLQSSSDAVFSAQQDTVAPTGFTNSLKLTTTTADASLAAGQYTRATQKIEGFNTADLGWGTANAQAVTLSFWVRSSVTGTFGGSLRNSAGNRNYPFSYAISAANTWEQKTITIAGDTTGTWLTNNGIGIELNWSLGTGTDLSGTAGAWTATAAVSATGATGIAGTLNATWFITGVQLEAGSVATPFERRPYGQELALCQRYFCSSFPIGSVPVNGVGTGDVIRNLVPYSTTQAYTDTVDFPQSMRTAPTVTIYNTGATATPNAFAYYDGGWRAASASTVYGANSNGFRVEPSGSFTAWVPRLGSFAWSASSEL